MRLTITNTKRERKLVMRKRFIGLDFLRGLAIFITLWMHTAFYYFNGLYTLDFNNPPLIVTIIGLMLMFAGVFAMVSGFVHTWQFLRKKHEFQLDDKMIFKYNGIASLLIFLIAYTYFLFTGPGLVNMAQQSMDNSFFVELILSGKINTISLDRILYVDSLVMIASNIALLSFVFYTIRKLPRLKQTRWYLALALMIFILSLVRIPLYTIYLQAVTNKQWGITLLLNWIVNKNNPILPFVSFGLMGAWLASELALHNFKNVSRKASILATILFIGGVISYIYLPDTMLERSIDLKWFAIMTAQLGLFMILILLVLRVFDFPSKPKMKRHNILVRFFSRFGVAGLTAFFLESIVSAIVYITIRQFIPNFSLDLMGALTYGFILAMIWGLWLIYWEKTNYRFGIEYWYTQILKKWGPSTKADKLRESKL